MIRDQALAAAEFQVGLADLALGRDEAVSDARHVFDLADADLARGLSLMFAGAISQYDLDRLAAESAHAAAAVDADGAAVHHVLAGLAPHTERLLKARALEDAYNIVGRPADEPELRVTEAQVAHAIGLLRADALRARGQALADARKTFVESKLDAEAALAHSLRSDQRAHSQTSAENLRAFGLAEIAAETELAQGAAELARASHVASASAEVDFVAALYSERADAAFEHFARWNRPDVDYFIAHARHEADWAGDRVGDWNSLHEDLADIGQAYDLTAAADHAALAARALHLSIDAHVAELAAESSRASSARSARDQFIRDWAAHDHARRVAHSQAQADFDAALAALELRLVTEPGFSNAQFLAERALAETAREQARTQADAAFNLALRQAARARDENLSHAEHALAQTLEPARRTRLETAAALARDEVLAGAARPARDIAAADRVLAFRLDHAASYLAAMQPLASQHQVGQAQADWQALQSHHPGVIAQAHTDHQNALTTANSTVTYLNDLAESTRVQYLAERAHTVTVYYTYSSVPSLPDALQAIANLYDNPAYVVAPPTGYAPPLVVVTALPQRLEAADAAPADLLADIHGEHYNPTLSGAYEQALAAMFGGAVGNPGPASAAADVVAHHLDEALRILYPQGGNLAVLGAQAGADWGVELFNGDGLTLEGFTRHLLNGRVFAGDKLAAMLPPGTYVFPEDYVSPEDEASSWWTPPVEWLDMINGWKVGLTFGAWEYLYGYQPYDNEWYEAGVQRGEAVWKIAGGLEEMAVGSVLLSGGSAGTATGFLAEIGIPVGLVGLGITLHGLDTFWAGLMQMGTGERQRTFTSRLIEVFTPLNEDQCEVVESVAFCLVNVYAIGNLGRQVARQLPRSASRVSRAAEVAENVPAPARNSADALPAARKAAEEQAGDAVQTARKVTDDATELPVAPNRVRRNSAGRVGPEFDPNKLESILDNLKLRGVTVDRGDDAIRWLNRQGAGAEYIAEQGRPGILLLRPGATRLEVVEELVHHGQAVRAKFHLPNASPQFIAATREIAAQDELLRIAQRLRWTQEEIDAISAARRYWLEMLERASQ